MSSHTEDDVRQALKALSNEQGKEKIGSALLAVGAVRLPDVPEVKYGALMAAVARLRGIDVPGANEPITVCVGEKLDGPSYDTITLHGLLEDSFCSSVPHATIRGFAELALKKLGVRFDKAELFDPAESSIDGWWVSSYPKLCCATYTFRTIAGVSVEAEIPIPGALPTNEVRRIAREWIAELHLSKNGLEVSVLMSLHYDNLRSVFEGSAEE